MDLNLNLPVGDFSPVESKPKDVDLKEFQRSLYAQYVALIESGKLDPMQAQQSELRTPVEVRFRIDQ